MTKEEREEKRLSIFNGILLMVQLVGLYASYPSFALEFENQMIENLGECTEEDIKWLDEKLEVKRV